ncbi:MAG: twin-arginine translocase TatA/TatE family subunit [Candidatus Omnitrophota bacterium]|jgi:sec-independent protein translocase protein TatA|nr:MAG: twin-arginine translocase TatA/TatE family subunit [Candidatus Omnitrophota bacterium]
MFPANIGLPEMIIIIFLVLMVFGAKRLPEVGKSLGQGIREFKKSLTAASIDEEEAEISAKDSPKIDKTNGSVS